MPQPALVSEQISPDGEPGPHRIGAVSSSQSQGPIAGAEQQASPFQQQVAAVPAMSVAERILVNVVAAKAKAKVNRKQ